MPEDDDTIPRLKAIVGDHGFAQLERFAEMLRKNPPTKEQVTEMLRERSRALGVTDADIQRIKKELFG